MAQSKDPNIQIAQLTPIIKQFINQLRLKPTVQQDDKKQKLIDQQSRRRYYNEPINPKKINKFQFWQPSSEKQPRERIPIISLDSITSAITQDQTEETIEYWMTHVCNTVFSIGFNYYLNGYMSFDQLKVFCTQGILKNIVHLSRKIEINHEFIKIMDLHLKQNILPFMMKKYPLTLQKQQNKNLKDIGNYNKLNDPIHDFIYNHGQQIKFEFDRLAGQSGKYNQSIMKVINSVLGKIDKQIQKQLDRQIESLIKMDKERAQKPDNLEANKKQCEIIKLKERIHEQRQNWNIFVGWINKFNNNPNQNPKTFSTYYDAFETFMSTIFEKVYNLEWVIDAEEQVQKNEEYTTNLISKQSFESEGKKPSKKDKLKEKQAEVEKKKAQTEYRQKVKSYTHYLIGRKVSQNVESFTKKQIQNDDYLNIKHPSILRIVTKWCEELQKKFINPQYLINQTSALPDLQNNVLISLSKKQKLQLIDLLKRQNVKIGQYLEKLKTNYYQMQNVQIQASCQKDGYHHIQIFQKAVGKCAIQTVNNLHIYMGLYLNRLIHGLLSVSDQWANKIKEDAKSSIKWKTIIKTQSKWIGKAPNLITFSIGDLIRCKCSSKERQILKIYEYLQSISKKTPEKFKILRIKNRLSQGTNDILINFKFNNLILGEIQLAVNTKQSKFIECSNNFSHYLYELQRTLFGPISELCSIWRNMDPCSSLYEEIAKGTKKTNFTIECNPKDKYLIVEKENHKVQTKKQCQHKWIRFELPFQCSFCHYFYYHNKYIQPNQKCEKCAICQCLKCKINFLNSEETWKSLGVISLSQISPFLGEVFQYRKWKEEGLPSIGISISWQGKKTIADLFFKISFEGNQKYFGVSSKNEMIYKIETENKKLMQNFKLSNLIFQICWKQQAQQIFKNKKGLQLITNILGQLSKKDEKLLTFRQKTQKKYYSRYVNLINGTLTPANIKQLKQILTMIIVPKMSERIIETEYRFVKNALKSYKQDKELFQLIKSDIKDQQLSNILKDIKAGGWSGLQFIELRLQKNNIQKIKPILTQFSNLQKLNIDKNRISSIEQIGKLVSLKELSVYGNSIKEIPQGFKLLVNLEKTNFGKNLISQIPETYFIELNPLKEFKIDSNQIIKIPSPHFLSRFDYFTISQQNKYAFEITHDGTEACYFQIKRFCIKMKAQRANSQPGGLAQMVLERKSYFKQNALFNSAIYQSYLFAQNIITKSQQKQERVTFTIATSNQMSYYIGFIIKKMSTNSSFRFGVSKNLKESNNYYEDVGQPDQKIESLSICVKYPNSNKINDQMFEVYIKASCKKDQCIVMFCSLDKLEWTIWQNGLEKSKYTYPLAKPCELTPFISLQTLSDEIQFMPKQLIRKIIL